VHSYGKELGVVGEMRYVDQMIHLQPVEPDYPMALILEKLDEECNEFNRGVRFPTTPNDISKIIKRDTPLFDFLFKNCLIPD